MSAGLGLLLIGAATALLVPAAVGAASKPLASLVITGVSVRVLPHRGLRAVLGAALEIRGRAEGLLMAVLALHAGLAFELEDNRLRTVLPTFRRGTGRTAIAGSVTDELDGLHREAGVRKQL